MRSNRACNQDWHLKPVYVSFEVDKDDICGGFKENEISNEIFKVLDSKLKEF